MTLTLWRIWPESFTIQGTLYTTKSFEIFVDRINVHVPNSLICFVIVEFYWSQCGHNNLTQLDWRPTSRQKMSSYQIDSRWLMDNE